MIIATVALPVAALGPAALPTIADGDATQAPGASSDWRAEAGSEPTAGDAAAVTAGQSTASAAGSVASAQTSEDADVVETVVYRRLPDGRLEAEIVYDVPATLTALEFQFERDDLEVAATDGFERSETPDLEWERDTDGATFTWDGETDAPRVVVRHDVPREEPATYAGGTDDWAVVLRPSTYTRWRYDGAEPAFGYDATVDGEGVAGEQFLVLGPHEVHETTVEGERIRLVVPEAADTASEPERILASLADASERLTVGQRSDVVTVVATPTEGVDWAHRGLSLGPDARVNDDVTVDAAPDLWVHEYVHTRQDRTATTAETEWLVEATAEYYAATAALERGQVGFSAYRGALAQGESGSASEAVLDEPDSWRGQANYRKGALVVAAIDRELRAATDGDATFQDVVAAWNDADEFDDAALAAELESLGGPAVRAYAEEHVGTSAAPELWDEQRHADVFDVDLARVTVGESTVDVRSGDAGRTLAGGAEQPLAADGADPDLAPSTDGAGVAGQLVAEVDVENHGDAPGRYRVPLRVDGTTVAVATGELAPGESRTVRLEHALRSPGEHAVQVGRPDETRRVTVAPPSERALDGIGVLDSLAALRGFGSSPANPAADGAVARQRAVGSGPTNSVAGAGQSVATASVDRDVSWVSPASGDGRTPTDERSADPASDAASGSASATSPQRTVGIGVLAALIGVLCVAGGFTRP